MDGIIQLLIRDEDRHVYSRQGTAGGAEEVVMNNEQNLQKAERLLATWNKETTRPESNRLDVVVTSDDLRRR